MSDLNHPLQHALTGSTTVKLFEQLRVAAVEAVRHSRCAVLVTRLSGDYRAMPRRQRTSAIGLVLVTAGIVHVLMNAAGGGSAGPFWLIVPATAVCIGLLGLIVGRAEPH